MELAGSVTFSFQCRALSFCLDASAESAGTSVFISLRMGICSGEWCWRPPGVNSPFACMAWQVECGLRDNILTLNLETGAADADVFVEVDIEFGGPEVVQVSCQAAAVGLWNVLPASGEPGVDPPVSVSRPAG